MLLTGHALITLPTTNKTLEMKGGDILIASDTSQVSKLGHDTLWGAGTSILLLPFLGGIVPNHTVVVEDGACDV